MAWVKTNRMGRTIASLIGLTVMAACVTASNAETKPVPDYVIAEYGQPPSVPEGPLSDDLAFAVRTVFVESLKHSTWDRDQMIALDQIATSDDPRLAWVITDMMRFTWRSQFDDALADAATTLLGITLETPNRWHEITNRLIAWDIPAHPEYLKTKRAIFTQFVDGWDNIFVEGDIDWRHVSWGGVLIDDRPYDTTDEPCNCIPASDNPETISASDATWLDDSAIVFGIEIDGEARAYPRQVMEVREMVNDTLGGRDLGIPYCTLCGSAQAYFTDELMAGMERPVLRTSGLLIRSNKVMYDITSGSVFDTFTGRAVTGDLAAKGVHLSQAAVITTDWGTWKAEHPNTSVLAEAEALGRNFDFRNGRDANGPIFPVGDVDPRLPVQEDVIGVVLSDGTPVAFQASKAVAALQSGAAVTFGDVQLKLAAGGVKVVDANGEDLGSHQAFWFAWSQFHPDTDLWRG